MSASTPSSDSPGSGLNTPPIIHSIYSQSTSTWQYIVADRTTGHCIVLDPVRDRCVDRATISTIAADAIIDVVRAHNHTVDYILETHAAGSQCLSAAWYLRMQFSGLQQAPPQICNEATVTGLEAMWQRKYGADNNFSTSIRGGLDDGESVMFGRLALTCFHLPGFGAAYRRAYLIDKDIFGAHSIAVGTEEPPNVCLSSASLEPHMDESERHLDAWSSINRILSLPGETRVWPDSGDDDVEGLRPFDVARCIELNKYAGTSKADYLTRRLVETQAFREWNQGPPSYKAVSLRSRLGSWIGV